MTPGRRRVPPAAGIVASLLAIVVLAWWLAGGREPPRPSGGARVPLVLYTAAGLVKPVQEVAADYAKQYGVTVQIEPGPSGKLLSNLKVTPGRAHLYLAADAWYVEKARAEGLVAETLPIARQQPVLVVARGNPRRIRSLEDLVRADVRVALANPEIASIGRTVKELLARSGHWDAIAARAKGGQIGVSFVGTVNEVAQAIKLGAADAGAVWDALVVPFGLEVVPVDAFAKPQEIVIGVVEPNTRATDSLHFARYLAAADRGLERFRAHNLKIIEDADRWAERPEVRLMAGAMLKPAIEDALGRFEAREGVVVHRVYNGCGVLVAQMKTGNTPDAYFACDVSFMRQVEERFEAPVTVSRNALALVVQAGNPKRLRSLADLAQPGLKIGLGHPQNSALGALTDALLRRAGVRDRVYGSGSTVVHADAGHMLVNRMRTGAFDAIVVYRSNIISAPADDRLEIVTLNQPDAAAAQPFATARHGGNRYLVRRMFDALSRERARFVALGFDWMLENGKP